MILKLNSDFIVSDFLKFFSKNEKLILFIQTTGSSKDNYLISPKMVADYLLQKINAKNIEHILKNTPPEISKFNCVGVLLEKNKVTCFAKNESQIYLNRKSTKAKIIDTGNGQITSVSGIPKLGDKFDICFSDQKIEIEITSIPKLNLSDEEKSKRNFLKDMFGLIALLFMLGLFITGIIISISNKRKAIIIKRQNQVEINRPFFDLSLISEKFTADILKVDSEKIIVFNKELNKLISVDLLSKNTQIIYQNSERENVKDVFLYQDRYFIFIDDKLFEIDGSGNKKEIVQNINPNFFYELFANNLYELNFDDGKIYKYQDLLTNNSVNKIEWLGVKVPPINPVGIKKMLIDGNVWLMFSGNKIDKYSNGIEQYYIFKNIDLGAISVDDFSTCEKCEMTYVLDRKQKRIIVFDKSGNFQKEIKDNRFIGTKEIFVTSDKDIFFVVGKKIFKLVE